MNIIKTNIIKSNIVELNQQQILKLIADHQPRIYKGIILQEYYEGYHDILERVIEDESQPNNRLVNNYSSYITDVSIGYFMGKPVSYTSSDEDFLNTIQEIFNYNDEQEINMELSKKASIKGTAYEILYIDENNNIRFGALDSKEVILVYDTSITPEPSFAIRHYEIDNILEDKEYIELYTKDMIYYYIRAGKGEITLIDKKEHYFGMVPIIEYPNNDERQGDFEKVLTLIDAYNLNQSNSANIFEYNDEAFLKIKNMSATDGEDVKSMKKNRVVLVEGDGDVGWVTKDQNDSAIENYKTRLNNDIHKFSKTPDLTDESFAGNLSGIAIEFKLWALEQGTVQKERKFKKALQRRIELINNILTTKGSNFNWRDIKLSFSRNMPINVPEITEVVTKLMGIISKQTALSLLPFVDDVTAELELIEQEKELYEDIDLDTVEPKEELNTEDDIETEEEEQEAQMES